MVSVWRFRERARRVERPSTRRATDPDKMNVIAGYLSDHFSCESGRRLEIHRICNQIVHFGYQFESTGSAKSSRSCQARTRQTRPREEASLHYSERRAQEDKEVRQLLRSLCIDIAQVGTGLNSD